MIPLFIPPFTLETEQVFFPLTAFSSKLTSKIPTARLPYVDCLAAPDICLLSIHNPLLDVGCQTVERLFDVDVTLS